MFIAIGEFFYSQNAPKSMSFVALPATDFTERA